MHFKYQVIFLASGTSMASMTSTTSVASMTFSDSFHQKTITELDVSINSGTKMTFSVLIMWVGLSKLNYFIDFWHPFFWRLWRTVMLLSTKSKGDKSNAPYLLRNPKLCTFKPYLTFTFLSVRARYIISKPDGRPCSIY